MQVSLKHVADYLGRKWERLLFVGVGGACLILTFRALVSGQIAAGSALFGMSFFSFFYANLARFKRFKGLGFEAELWEDKQREAADLIDRLQGLVSSYTREAVMGSVMRGRFSDGDDWASRWNLFNGLTGKHKELGQNIDFTDLKRDVDRVFVFDICNALADSVRNSIESGKSEALQLISQRYGSPITDVSGYNRDMQNIRLIDYEFGNLFAKTQTENIATYVIEAYRQAAGVLSNHFSVNIILKPTVSERLQQLSTLIDSGPIQITPELIDWANWRADRY